MRYFVGLLVAAALCVFSDARANTQSSAQEAKAPDISWQDKLNHQTGVIQLPSSSARLNIGPDYYFLDKAASQRVLVEGWGNPPDAANGVLGMIFPAKYKPLDAAAWGAVITYQDVGYVSDKDARKTDSDKLLKDLRDGEDESNAERQKQGYSSVHLAGWAERPTYDAGRHVVIWAQDLQFGNAEQHTLNYDIRLLGRRGVLSLNVVASMQDLAQVKAAANSVVSQAGFETGSRYADFQQGQDKVAEYGVAGLIAAGVGVAAAKKLGFLALAMVFLKKGFVIIAAGFAAVANWARRLFGKKKDAPASTPQGPDLIS
jgi:uncharacterized membrane-anchored protein